MFIDVKNNHENSVIVHIWRKVHIVQRLTVKLLLRMNIIDLEKMMIDANTCLMILKSHNSCMFSIDLKSLEFFNWIKRVHNIKNVTVKVHTVIWISIDHWAKMISKTTYEFVSVYFSFIQYIEKKDEIYHHLVNHEFSAVQIRNDLNTFFNIFHHITLDHVINEIVKTQCY